MVSNSIGLGDSFTMCCVIVVLLGCCKWTSKVNEVKKIKGGYYNFEAVTHRISTEAVQYEPKLFNVYINSLLVEVNEKVKWKR